jgi:hypothetical protein
MESLCEATEAESKRTKASRAAARDEEEAEKYLDDMYPEDEA